LPNAQILQKIDTKLAIENLQVRQPCLFSAVIKFKIGHSRIQSFQTGIAPFIDSLNTSGVKKIPRNPDFLRKESYYSSLDIVC
jgi:hypothetical protein